MVNKYAYSILEANMVNEAIKINPLLIVDIC